MPEGKRGTVKSIAAAGNGGVSTVALQIDTPPQADVAAEVKAPAPVETKVATPKPSTEVTEKK